MPILLIVLGILATISAVRGTEHELAAQIASDFSGTPSYSYWVIAIIVIGSIGYIPGLDKVTTLFLVLIVLAFILENGGVFNQFQEAV